MLHLLCIWCFLNGIKATLKVSVPKRHVIAVRGQPAVLGCSYTPEPSSTLKGLVVTWQMADSSQVVHSFYYGTNQLDQQSQRFQNRTSLYPSELLVGNVSLRLNEVQLQDSGLYICSVSTFKGTGKGEVMLEYAAFYSEPRLRILVHPSNISFQYESEGYPKPVVQWLGPTDQFLLNHSKVSPQAGDDGFLTLRTYVVVLNKKQSVELTFTLQNQVLGQFMERRVSFHNDNPEFFTRYHFILPTVLCLIFFSALCLAVIYIYKMRSPISDRHHMNCLHSRLPWRRNTTNSI